MHALHKIKVKKITESTNKNLVTIKSFYANVKCIYIKIIF